MDPCLLPALVQVELGQLQIAWLCNLQINLRTMNYGDRISGAFDNGSFIGTYKAIGSGFGEGALEQPIAEALGGLREHDVLARDGGGDQGAVGGALDLLDGVDGRHADDGGAEFGNGVDGAVDCGRVDERTNGVVHQDDVIGLGGQRGQGVGDRLLSVVATFDHMHAIGKSVFGNLRLNAVDFGVADGDVDRGDAGDGSEGAERVDEDGHALEGQELLGLRAGHPGPQSGSGKDYEYLHNSWSIHRMRGCAAGELGKDCGRIAMRAAYHFGMRPAERPTRSQKQTGELPIDTTLLKPGLRLAVGLSGGADSVALLRALAGRREELGLVLHAAHLHHGLRGEEADGDLTFARELAASLGLPFHEGRVDVAAEAQANRATGKGAESTEEAARRLRYAWFRQLMGEGLVDAVATAHTLDDQAETVLAKFLRGAWTEGLSGIHPVLEFAEGSIVRPLLATRRAEIEGYLKALGQSWREDSSNRQLTFTRNRIRHELLPLLEGWNPRLREHLAQMAGLARDEEAWWTAELARLAPQVLMPGRPVRGGGRAAGDAATMLSIDVTRLAGLAPAVQRRLLRNASVQLGAAPDFSATEAMRTLALAGRAGQKLELADGSRVERTHRELRLMAGAIGAASRAGADAPPEYAGTIPGEIEAPAFGITLRIGVSSSAEGQGTGNRGAVTLRSWKPGDRVTLRYSSGPRKVKEVLERMRVTGTGRTFWPVLELDGRIVWMQGVELQPEDGLRFESFPL